MIAYTRYLRSAVISRIKVNAKYIIFQMCRLYLVIWDWNIFENKQRLNRIVWFMVLTGQHNIWNWKMSKSKHVTVQFGLTYHLILGYISHSKVTIALSKTRTRFVLHIWSDACRIVHFIWSMQIDVVMIISMIKFHEKRRNERDNNNNNKKCQLINDYQLMSLIDSPNEFIVKFTIHRGILFLFKSIVSNIKSRFTRHSLLIISSQLNLMKCLNALFDLCCRFAGIDTNELTLNRSNRERSAGFVVTTIQIIKNTICFSIWKTCETWNQLHKYLRLKIHRRKMRDENQFCWIMK